jgi:hypothetical protein
MIMLNAQRATINGQRSTRKPHQYPVFHPDHYFLFIHGGQDDPNFHCVEIDRYWDRERPGIKRVGAVA